MDFKVCCNTIEHIKTMGVLTINTADMVQFKLEGCGSVSWQSTGLYCTLHCYDTDKFYRVNYSEKTVYEISKEEAHENIIQITDSERFKAVVLRLMFEEENAKKFMQEFINNPMMSLEHSLTYHAAKLSYIKELLDFVKEESE